MFLVSRRNNGRSPHPASLRRWQHIDIKRRDVRRGSPCLSGLSPQFRGKTKGIVVQGHVSVWSGIDEGVQTGDPADLIRPQQFAFVLVIYNCRHENPSARTEAVLEPVRYRDDLLATLWLGDETERSRIKQKRRSRVGERFT